MNGLLDAPPAPARAAPAKRAEVRAARAGFDLGWMRIWLSVGLVAAVGLAAGAAFGAVPPWLSALGVPVVALGLCLYYGHLLFRRLRCSLAEWCAIVLVMGNALGLCLTAPGMGVLLGLAGWLGPVLVAWTLCGAVQGLAQADLLGIRAFAGRLALMAAGWWTTAAPALLALGAALHWAKSFDLFLGPRQTSWALPLFVLGTAGLVLGAVLRVKAASAARERLRTAAAEPASAA
ncbi:MAG: hypothetical protein M5U26_04090 [Planctomycetota bacterium]|nr:hypothetical protein [Planctomycetota bacterium]